MDGNPALHHTETASILNRLSAIAERMTTNWNNTHTEIDSLAGQLGKGELGAAFLAGYQQPAADTARAIDQHCRQPHELATSGNHAIAGLTGVDSANQQAIHQDPANP